MKIFNIAMAQLPFKLQNSYEKRKNISSNIRLKYPNKIPIIIEPYRDTDPKILKIKFLVSYDITVGNLIYQIRQHMESIDEKTGLSFYIRSNKGEKSLSDIYTYGLSYISLPSDMILAPMAYTIGIVYNNNKDDDGFLYMTYAAENTFGSSPDI